MSGLTLALDTSGAVAAGLARDGVVLAADRHEDSRAHVEQLTVLVQRLLSGAGASWDDVERVAVGTGPGPFTGLRVGIAAAEVLALALGVPCTGVCSLDVIARQTVLSGALPPVPGDRSGGGRGEEGVEGDGTGADFVVVTDARRREVYWAGYRADGRRVDGPAVGAAATVPGLPVAGPGGQLDPELADRSLAAVGALDAGVLAAELDRLPVAGLEPLYLRRPDAVAPGRPKSTLVPPPPLRSRPGGRR